MGSSRSRTPNRKRSGILAKFEASQDRSDVARREPALKPALLALHLLKGANDPSMDPFERFLVSRCVDWVVAYYLEHVDEDGWFGVAAPSEQVVLEDLGGMLETSTWLSEPLGKRFARREAKGFAPHVQKMWPAVPYLVLDELAWDLGHPWCLELEWVRDDVTDKLNPGFRALPRRRNRRLDALLWEEAFILLAGQSPGALKPDIDRYALGKVRDRLGVTPTKAAELAEEAVGKIRTKRPFISAYRPIGVPARAIRFLRTSLERAAMDVRDPDAAPPGTIRRAVSEGKLPKRSSRAQRQKYTHDADLLRSHRAVGYWTGRQLADELGITIGRLQRAIAKVEKDQKKRVERDPRNKALRIDAGWRQAIEEKLGIATTAKRVALACGCTLQEVQAMCEKKKLPSKALSRDDAEELLEEMKLRGLIDISTSGELDMDELRFTPPER